MAAGGEGRGRVPGGFVLVAGMVLFGVAMSALVAWLIFGGVAGKERGLVFKNLTSAPVELRLDDGRDIRLTPDAEQTLPVKREQFPQNFAVYDAAGAFRYKQEYRFEEFKDFEFRVGIGPDGFVTVSPPTTN
jgi:hypothetical protein